MTTWESLRTGDVLMSRCPEHGDPQVHLILQAGDNNVGHLSFRLMTNELSWVRADPNLIDENRWEVLRASSPQ